MMSKTFGLLFFIRKPKNKTNEAGIYMRLTVDQQRTEVSTKRFCDPIRWNSSTGRMNGNKEDAKSLNVYLDTLQAKVYEIYRRLLETGDPVNAETIKNRLLGNTARPRLLLEVFLQHNEQMLKLIQVGDYANGTYKHFKTAYNHLRDFIPWKFRQKDIDVRKATHEMISAFEYYLKVEKKIGHNSCMKYMGNLKKVLLICIKNDWLEKNPFTGYQLVRRPVVTDYLSMEEIEALAKANLKQITHCQVRDIFLFSCYTGLAYADVLKLSRSEIQKGPDGHTWLFSERQKTGTPTPVPLLPICFEIMDKYKDHPKCIKNDRIFPVYSNQKMNMYIKEVAAIAGVKKHISYHMARHSFATAVTLNNDVPIETVSQMMGHKNIKQTQHYAKVLNRKVAEDMNVLRQKMRAASAST